jgi:hypothetical protein
MSEVIDAALHMFKPDPLISGFLTKVRARYTSKLKKGLSKSRLGISYMAKEMASTKTYEPDTAKYSEWNVVRYGADYSECVENAFADYDYSRDPVSLVQVPLRFILRDTDD